jgi:hypothetical protein
MSRDAELKQGYKNGHDAALARAIFAVVRESLEGHGAAAATSALIAAAQDLGLLKNLREQLAALKGKE